MEEENEVLDWGNEDDEQFADQNKNHESNRNGGSHDHQRRGKGDDADEVVSLGGEEDDIQELNDFRSRSQAGQEGPVHKVRPSEKTLPPISEKKSSRRDVIEPPDQQHDRRPEARSRHEAEHPYRSGEGPRALNGSPVNSKSSSQRKEPAVIPGLPPKPTVTPATFRMAPDPSLMEASTMASVTRLQERERRNAESPIKEGATADEFGALPPDWEIRYSKSRETLGEKYYYNTRTNVTQWDRPSVERKRSTSRSRYPERTSRRSRSVEADDSRNHGQGSSRLTDRLSDGLHRRPISPTHSTQLKESKRERGHQSPRETEILSSRQSGDRRNDTYSHRPGPRSLNDHQDPKADSRRDREGKESLVATQDSQRRETQSRRRSFSPAVGRTERNVSIRSTRDSEDDRGRSSLKGEYTRFSPSEEMRGHSQRGGSLTRHSDHNANHASSAPTRRPISPKRMRDRSEERAFGSRRHQGESSSYRQTSSDIVNEKGRYDDLSIALGRQSTKVTAQEYVPRRSREMDADTMLTPDYDAKRRRTEFSNPDSSFARKLSSRAESPDLLYSQIPNLPMSRSEEGDYRQNKRYPLPAQGERFKELSSTGSSHPYATVPSVSAPRGPRDGGTDEYRGEKRPSAPAGPRLGPLPRPHIDTSRNDTLQRGQSGSSLAYPGSARTDYVGYEEGDKVNRSRGYGRSNIDAMDVDSPAVSTPRSRLSNEVPYVDRKSGDHDRFSNKEGVPKAPRAMVTAAMNSPKPPFQSDASPASPRKSSRFGKPLGDDTTHVAFSENHENVEKRQQYSPPQEERERQGLPRQIPTSHIDTNVPNRDRRNEADTHMQTRANILGAHYTHLPNRKESWDHQNVVMGRGPIKSLNNQSSMIINRHPPDMVYNISSSLQTRNSREFHPDRNVFQEGLEENSQILPHEVAKESARPRTSRFSQPHEQAKEIISPVEQPRTWTPRGQVPDISNNVGQRNVPQDDGHIRGPRSFDRKADSPALHVDHAFPVYEAYESRNEPSSRLERRISMQTFPSKENFESPSDVLLSKVHPDRMHLIPAESRSQTDHKLSQTKQNVLSLSSAEVHSSRPPIRIRRPSGKESEEPVTFGRDARQYTGSSYRQDVVDRESHDRDGRPKAARGSSLLERLNMDPTPSLRERVEQQAIRGKDEEEEKLEDSDWNRQHPDHVEPNNGMRQRGRQRRNKTKGRS